MAGVELATAYVAIVPSASGIAANLSKEMGGPLQEAAKKSGAESSKSFGSAFGSGLKTAMKAATIGIGAIVGGGIGLAKLGADFDDAFDKIRVGTGATGKALEGLQDSFKTVFASVPVSMADASSAVEGLNVGLKLTGKPLEALSAQVLNLSRVTGTDLSTNVSAVTGLFNSWGVAAAQQGPKLDELFRVSQATGISVSDLATQMASGGTAFRQAGLSYESTASLLGLLAKQGLSASDVVPALSKAMATAAKDGKPAAQVFKSTFDAIRSAPNDTKAAGIAMDIFGAKAGPKFAALIREGKLSYEDLAKTIAAGGDTINAAANQTDDWKEKLKLLTNKGLVLLEPIASRVFSALTRAIEIVTPWLSSFAGWLGREIPVAAAAVTSWFNGHVMPAIRAVADFFVRNWPAIKAVVVEVFDGIKTAVSYVVDTVLPKLGQGIQAAFKFMMDHKEVLVGALVAIGIGLAAWAISAAEAAIATIAATAPLVAIAVAIGAVVAGVIYAYKHWQTFHDVVDAVGRFLRDKLWPAMKEVFGWLKDNVPPILEAIGRFFRDKVLPVLEAVGRFLRDDFWPVVKAVFGWLRDNIPPILQAIVGFFRDKVIPVVQAVIGFFRDDFWPVVQAVFGWIRDNVVPILAAVGSFFIDTLLPPIVTVAKFIGETLWTAAKDVFGWFQTYLPPIFNLISGVFTDVFLPALKAIGSFISEHLLPAAQLVFGWLRDNIPTIFAALKTVFDTVIQPPLDLLKAVFGFIYDKATQAFEWLRDNIPTILAGLQTVFNTVILPVLNVFKTVFGDIFDGASKAFGWLRDNVGPIIGDVSRIIGTVISVVLTPLIAVINGVIAAFKLAWETAYEIYLKIEQLASGGLPASKSGEIAGGGKQSGGGTSNRQAKGGVNYRPTLALVGDNPGAATDPEIVAPQSMMARTFEDVLMNHSNNNPASSWPDEITLIVEGEPITARIQRNNRELAGALMAGQR